MYVPTHVHICTRTDSVMHANMHTLTNSLTHTHRPAHVPHRHTLTDTWATPTPTDWHMGHTDTETHTH